MLSVIVGFALLRTPFQSVEVFIFVLGIFWLVQGLMTFVAAFATKEGRNWRIFIGILGVVAGVIILIYPISSALTLAFIGGIWLVVLGIFQVIAGFRLRTGPPGLNVPGGPCYPVARRRPGAPDAHDTGPARASRPRSGVAQW